MRTPVVIGGLGGGGDVGLALMIAWSMGLWENDIVVASFLNCSAGENRLRGLNIH